MLFRSLTAAVLCGLLGLPALGDNLVLTGVLRDFHRGDKTGGHPDFETCNTVSGHGTYGVVPGLVSMTLGTDNKPVYNTTRPSNDSMSGKTNFNQWYNDTKGVNTPAASYKITLTNGLNTTGGVYSYTNSNFFPLDGAGFGNESLNHNFGFTFELHTTFTYQPGQNFTFIGDDDVWVFINGTKVIDIGGVHSAATGNVLLFDGKAFVNKTAFPVAGVVKSVTSSYASQLATLWSQQKIAGTCPVKSGDSYIDLSLTYGNVGASQTGNATITPTFQSTSVAVQSTLKLDNVVLKFADGIEQKFDNLTGQSGTFAGTGSNNGKAITGCWVLSGGNNSSYGQNYGQWFPASGNVGTSCKLDFFFAERHTTQSTFRIDTSILLNAAKPTSLTSLYD